MDHYQRAIEFPLFIINAISAIPTDIKKRVIATYKLRSKYFPVLAKQLYSPNI